MSLVHCPECGHEISGNAIACPNCGRPISTPPVIERKVIVAAPPRERQFPPWALIPIGLLGVILLMVMYMVYRQSDETANMNVNVNGSRRTTSVPETRTDSRTATVPPGESAPVTGPAQTTTVPGTTTAPPTAPPPDKGTVVLNARISSPRSGAQAARGTKFYLLDRDLETILSEARVEPIEGNTLTGSLGLATVFPDRYSDFQHAAMRAIAGHAKYSGTTSSSGSAGLSGVAPGEYYLFGITHVARGFALWNSPVSVIPGENIMNLSPQSVTEVAEPTG